MGAKGARADRGGSKARSEQPSRASVHQAHVEDRADRAGGGRARPTPYRVWCRNRTDETRRGIGGFVKVEEGLYERDRAS